MKKILILFTFVIPVSMGVQAQIATQIDSKSITLPRYSNLSAITSSLPAPQHGMMVYNTATATNWFYNGSTWVNLALATSAPSEPEGFGSWGCNNSAFEAYQPVANLAGSSYEYFGESVAISGDFAIVGATEDNEGGLSKTGSATVFKRNTTTGAWESQGKLVNPAGDTYDYFGRSVAISGDYAIVGAYQDEGGFNENGSATVFKRNTTTGVWESQGKLLNPASANNDQFGYSVAISEDYAIVGARYDDEGGFTNNGSATVFKRNTATGAWESQGKLVDPSGASFDYFGESVAISGDYVIVGAYSDDEGGLTDNGSATVFKRNATTGAWESQGKLVHIIASNSDNFGISVSISGDYAIVGAKNDDEGGFTDIGSATVFKRNTTTGAWGYHTMLVNPSGTNTDYFGSSVAISGDYAIVGAPRDDEGIFTDNGSFTVYRRYEGVWRLITKTSDPGSNTLNLLGSSCAIDGNTGRFLIGAPYVSSSIGLAIFGKVK